MTHPRKKDSKSCTYICFPLNKDHLRLCKMLFQSSYITSKAVPFKAGLIVKSTI